MSLPYKITLRMVTACADSDGKAALDVCRDTLVFLVSGQLAEAADEPTPPKPASAAVRR